MLPIAAEAEHLPADRGTRKEVTVYSKVRLTGSATVTSALRGVLRDDARSRSEFFALAGITS